MGCAFLLSCGGGHHTDSGRRQYLDAVARQNDGAYEEALELYHQVMRDCDDRAIRAKAELGATQVELAFEQRDRALKQMRRAASQADRIALPHLRTRIDAIADQFANTPFAEDLHEAARIAKAAAVQRRQRLREVTVEAVKRLVERGEYTAALETLRSMEQKRSADDRADITSLLGSIRDQSEREAQQLLLQVDLEVARGGENAGAILDGVMVRFTGTHAGAQLAKKRLELSPARADRHNLPAGQGSLPGKTATDHQR